MLLYLMWFFFRSYLYSILIFYTNKLYFKFDFFFDDYCLWIGKLGELRSSSCFNLTWDVQSIIAGRRRFILPFLVVLRDSSYGDWELYFYVFSIAERKRNLYLNSNNRKVMWEGHGLFVENKILEEKSQWIPQYNIFTSTLDDSLYFLRRLKVNS